jgi:hypothetical protein
MLSINPDDRPSFNEIVNKGYLDYSSRKLEIFTVVNELQNNSP